MSWVYLFLAIIFETAATTLLKMAENPTLKVISIFILIKKRAFNLLNNSLLI